MRSGIEPITKQPITATAHELKKGHTHNQATDPGYLDPSLAVATAAEPDDEQALSDWMLSLIKTMRADMDNDKLYPPGKVYIMVSECCKAHSSLMITRNTLPCTSLEKLRSLSNRVRGEHVVEKLTELSVTSSQSYGLQLTCGDPSAV
jgi:hypothetical protein